MVETANFVQRKFGALTPDQDLMWDKPECPLSQAFVDDLQQIGSVAAAARQLTVPWLLSHGSADTVVPIEDARAVVDNPNATLIELDGIDHIFSEAHDPMTAAVARWLQTSAND
jgi:pimeloyl-ACP methyl ester carboxylesterase